MTDCNLDRQACTAWVILDRTYNSIIILILPICARVLISTPPCLPQTYYVTKSYHLHQAGAIAMAENIPSRNVTVTTVGGAIGGVSLALGLLRRNVPVQIYEAAAEFKEVGLGLTISPTIYRALPLLIREFVKRTMALMTTHADIPRCEEFPDTWLDEKSLSLLGQTCLRSADFLDSLVSFMLREIVHFGKSLSYLSETEHGVDLFFEDGKVADGDIVVGCDGIRSKAKQSMLPEEYEQSLSRYSGWTPVERSWIWKIWLRQSETRDSIV